MIIREDAIYGRQSVDRKDSISIESQIEFCKYELRGGNFRKYTDKGYSGKNTDRPEGVPSYFSASVLSGSSCSEIEAPLLIGERPSR